MSKFFFLPAGALSLLALPCAALASGGHHPSIPGAELSAVWVVPFVCMLLSIAVLPLTLPHFWEHHFGKIAVFWGLAFLVPCLLVYGSGTTLYVFLHTILLDYIPFLILIFSLFAVAGGVRLTGSLTGSPLVNTGILAVGTALASWMGTTGAAVLLIRPLLRANAHRKYRVHSVVFFIFLVANIGGSLTPLGDPPLFLGFLKGVSFFWTTTHLFLKTVFMAVVLLGVFYILDTVLFAREGKPVPPHTPERAREKLGLDGKVNLLFLLGIVAVVLASGLIQTGEIISVYGVGIEGQNLMRDLLLLTIAWLSWKFTEQRCRELNGFSWAPIAEVAKLFLGIFISMIPAIEILRAGTRGALAPLIRLVTSADGQPVNAAYFWLTGALSSFLDNAPTYLVFFNTAGGDAAALMTGMGTTLAAISAGAVFMGANSYIGNAPNFMVRSIAEEQGVPMPSFFGYMAWSAGILVPLFVVLTWIFF
ncbi:MAG: sodium:proton antiporter [Desulfovibrio sp.]|jgi:Na+/H+ antiporter NhaD/arsenite permease-like protein|nr:sodium:proton antiporter [Desulfovibrio sp.]